MTKNNIRPWYLTDIPNIPSDNSQSNNSNELFLCYSYDKPKIFINPDYLTPIQTEKPITHYERFLPRTKENLIDVLQIIDNISIEDLVKFLPTKIKRKSNVHLGIFIKNFTSGYIRKIKGYTRSGCCGGLVYGGEPIYSNEHVDQGAVLDLFIIDQMEKIFPEWKNN